MQTGCKFKKREKIQFKWFIRQHCKSLTNLRRANISMVCPLWIETEHVAAAQDTWTPCYDKSNSKCVRGTAWRSSCSFGIYSFRTPNISPAPYFLWYFETIHIPTGRLDRALAEDCKSVSHVFSQQDPWTPTREMARKDQKITWVSVQ